MSHLITSLNPKCPACGSWMLVSPKGQVCESCGIVLAGRPSEPEKPTFEPPKTWRERPTRTEICKPGEEW